MRNENRITRLLWSALAQTAMIASALAAKAAPADDLPLPPQPSGMGTAPVNPSLPPAPAPQAESIPAATAASQPLYLATPAPQAETAPSGDTGPANEWCHKVGGGCHHVDCRELPFGACVRANLKVQICNGLAARFVLYEYDFCDAASCDGCKLSPKGYERLTDIARMYPASNFQPIVIESTQDPTLDAARRDYVWKSLLQMDRPVPGQLVVVGHPRTPSLNGQEAAILHVNLLKQTQGAMSIGGGGGGGVAGSGGGAATPGASSGPSTGAGGSGL